MGGVGKMPGQGQFIEGVVFDFPTQVTPVADRRSDLTIQIPSHDPDPVLFLFLSDPC